jgi:hypothetical protein
VCQHARAECLCNGQITNFSPMVWVQLHRQALQCVVSRSARVVSAIASRAALVRLCLVMLCAAMCCEQGVVRRDEDFWQSQWRRLKRMMFEVRSD